MAEIANAKLKSSSGGASSSKSTSSSGGGGGGMMAEIANAKLKSSAAPPKKETPAPASASGGNNAMLNAIAKKTAALKTAVKSDDDDWEAEDSAPVIKVATKKPDPPKSEPKAETVTAPKSEEVKPSAVASSWNKKKDSSVNAADVAKVVTPAPAPPAPTPAATPPPTKVATAAAWNKKK